MVAEKKQRLARLGHRRHDLADIVHKAHIEHPVGFIEDQEFDRIEPDMPLLHEIEQPPGRRNQNVEPTNQRSDLRLLADTTEDHGLTQREVLAVGAEFLTDLDSKLTGRRQDQGARFAGCFVGAVVITVFNIVAVVAGGAIVAAWPRQLLKNGQRKSRGFAGACLGNTQHVTPGEKLRDGSRLDRRLGLRGLCRSTHAVSDRSNRVPRIYE